MLSIQNQQLRKNLFQQSPLVNHLIRIYPNMSLLHRRINQQNHTFTFQEYVFFVFGLSQCFISIFFKKNSDDEQQVSSVNQFETPSYNVDHIPSQLNRRHRQIDQEQTHIHGLTTTTTTKKKKDQQSYDNLDNSMTKNKRKSKVN